MNLETMTVVAYEGECKCNKFRLDNLLTTYKIILRNTAKTCDICNFEQISCQIELYYEADLYGVSFHFTHSCITRFLVNCKDL